MNKILLFLLLFCSKNAFAQNKAFIDSIINNRSIKIYEYKFESNTTKFRRYEMPFGLSYFIDTFGLEEIKSSDIISIDLVFSDYPQWLDLKELNKRRFISLNKYLPLAVIDNNIKWQVIRQTKGKDKASSKKLFHGFVINYRAKNTPTTLEEDITYLKTITPPPAQPVIKDTVPAKTIKPPKKPNNWDLKTRGGKYSIPPPTEKTTEVETGFDITKRLNPIPVLTDSTILKVIDRNNFDNMLIVADVTGSMTRFIGQLIYFINIQANANKVKYVVCFNDGDRKADKLKIEGQTGGIYGEPFYNIQQVSNLIQGTISRGQGGDLPENDCEALIKAQTMFPNFGDLVLLADSWAPVRDIALVTQIKKPVRIILSEKNVGPHADFVTLALATGGSLHFLNEDVIDLMPLKQGKELIIKGRFYRVRNGRVEQVVK